MVSSFRVTFLILGILIVFGYLAFNLYQLQIARGSYYSERAENQYQLAGFLEPHRGVVYFTDKEFNKIPAALNKSYPVIFAVPKEVEDAQEASRILGEILSIDEEDLQLALTNKQSLYKLLKKKASDSEVARTREVNLKGIYIDEQEFRFYPFDGLASHLLGFISPSSESDELIGRYGIEREFNQSLAGIPGEIDGDRISRPVQGSDLALTIDRNIQNRAEEILKNLIDQYQAVGGTVIVQEPETGNILAWGSYPSFNPNSYSQFDIGNFLDPAHQSIYEPGSIFKVITMAVALDKGVISPETTYYDTGELHLNGRVIKNWDLKAHGTQTMTEVIEKSLNIGSAFAARKIGQDNFYGYLNNFGLTEPTGIQLPSEVVGSIENLKKNREINLATASFGQGISVTPIALINAVSALANDGVLMRPNLLQNNKSQRVRQVISKNASRQITDMMTSAVKKAKLGSVDNYHVAGKTGTAQVPDFNKGGYSDQVINTYIGFAPSSDPKFTVMIKLDKPAGAPLAGMTVVPAFRELTEFILNYYNIPPDNLQ